MRKFMRKSLIYLLAVGMLMPTWLVTGMMSATKAKAAVTINEGFGAGITAPTDWVFANIGGTYTTVGNYGVASPSLQLDATGDSVLTPMFSNASSLSFWIKGEGSTSGSSLLVETFDGSTWSILDTVSSLPTTGAVKTYSLDAQDKQVRLTYSKISGNVALDDVVISDNLPNHDVKNITTNSYYSSLQEAISEASAGDELSVEPKFYTGRAIIDKPLTIKSATQALFQSVFLGSSGIVFENISAGETIVGGTGSINTAISITDSVESNGTVYVMSGTYNESVIINHDVNLVGEPEKFPIIKVAMGDAVTVNSATNTLITGFEIKDSAIGISNNTTGTKINGNIFTNNTVNIRNNSTGALDAVGNYWGEGDRKISNIGTATTSYSPWYLERGMINYQFEVVPNDSGQVTTTLPIDVGTYNDLPSGRVIVEMTTGTIVTADTSWDGKLANGVTADNSGINLASGGKITENLEAIEIGAGELNLTFSKPVKITLEGKAGKKVGFLHGTVFTEITTECGSDLSSPVLSSTGECKSNIGSDLIVLTKHFTKFATYTQTEVVAPVFIATALTNNGVKTVHIAWKGTGADSYIINVGGVETTTVADSNDLNKSYTKDVAVLNYGKYNVSVTAVKSSVRSINNVTSTVEFVAPATVATAATSTTTETVATSVAPAKVKAAAPAPAEQKIETPADDSNGKIKGDDTTDKDEEEKVNWTPWIVLFVLILLAGAATGGYFYWFNGEEEVQAVVKEPKKVEKVVAKPQANVKKSSNQKKQKRW